MFITCNLNSVKLNKRFYKALTELCSETKLNGRRI